MAPGEVREFHPTPEWRAKEGCKTLAEVNAELIRVVRLFRDGIPAEAGPQLLAAEGAIAGLLRRSIGRAGPRPTSRLVDAIHEAITADLDKAMSEVQDTQRVVGKNCTALRKLEAKLRALEPAARWIEGLDAWRCSCRNCEDGALETCRNCGGPRPAKGGPVEKFSQEAMFSSSAGHEAHRATERMMEVMNRVGVLESDLRVLESNQIEAEVDRIARPKKEGDWVHSLHFLLYLAFALVGFLVGWSFA